MWLIKNSPLQPERAIFILGQIIYLPLELKFSSQSRRPYRRQRQQVRHLSALACQQ